MSGQDDYVDSGTPERGYFTTRAGGMISPSGTPDRGYFTSRTGRMTSPGGTVILGSMPSSSAGQTIQIVMPPGGANQGSGFRISMSSGQDTRTPGGSTIILGGSHRSSVTFSTLPRRARPTHGGGMVAGGHEVRRVRRIHSSDDMMTPSVGRVTFSTPQIEEHVYRPASCTNPGIETKRVTGSAPVHEDNVYRPMGIPPQDVKQVYVHKIHLVRPADGQKAAKDECGTPQSGLSSSGSGVPVSAAVGVGGTRHESASHEPPSQSTWASVGDSCVGTESSSRFYVVSPTDTKTRFDTQRRDTDRLRQFDDTITNNMRRFMSRGGQSDGVGYDTPPGSQQQPRGRKLPVITITHRRKTSGDQPSEIHGEAPMTPDDKRDLFRKFKFRFGSIGEFAGSGGSGSGGSESGGSTSGSGGRTRSGKPEMFYFQDFDDLASRIRILWSSRQEKPTHDCQYTCHHKCRPLVTLDCEHCLPSESTERISRNHSDTSLMTEKPQVMKKGRRRKRDDADSGYHTGNSTLQAVAAAARGAGHDSAALSREELRCHIQAFNNNHHGLIMTLDPQSETFQGFIRVHLNLIRPINMSVSGRPPSFYEVLTHEDEGEEEEHITSFYLPKNTTKVVHISSGTTTEQVICALLAKYKITDNPRKFALYEKVDKDGKVTMQRLADDKCPLPQCLGWTAKGLDTHMFVLQENDTGEIIWEAFSLPELENFLKILDREEAEYAEQVKAKYHLLKLQMKQRLKHLEAESPSDGKRQPVFV